MEPASYTKQPWEKRQLSFDASEALQVGDSVASISGVTIWEGTTDRTDAMLEGITHVGNIVYCTIKAGSHGTTYWLRIRVVTTNGYQIEDDIKVVVRQLGQ